MGNINRRTFLGFAGGGIVLSALLTYTDLVVAFRKFKGKLLRPLHIPHTRGVAALPDSRHISLETSLNSRCMSDLDGDQSVFHWGLIDISKALPDSAIDRVVQNAKIRRLGSADVGIVRNDNTLTFYIVEGLSNKDKNVALIENGMLQQSVCLTCAALGIGIVPFHLGVAGTPIGNGRIGTIRYQLEPMLPSYRSEFWSEEYAGSKRSWMGGNLPLPLLNSRRSYWETIERIEDADRPRERRTDDNMVSQLLWAARGRTPHYYMSREWGMTIPAAFGVQDRSSIRVARNQQEHSFLNQRGRRAAHEIVSGRAIQKTRWEAMRERCHGATNIFELCSASMESTALYEIGFMLHNMYVQSISSSSELKIEIAHEEKDLAGHDARILVGI